MLQFMGSQRTRHDCETELKAFDCVDHNTLGKFLRNGNTRPLYLPQEICMEVKKQELEPYVEQQTGSKLGKE